MSDSAWQVFDVETIRAQMSNKSVEYREFLRVPTVSCGLYHLAAGSQDMQTPHDEDEMYFVLEGRAQLQVGDEVHEVKPGSILYVQAAEAQLEFDLEKQQVILHLVNGHVDIPGKRRAWFKRDDIPVPLPNHASITDDA